jgi:hypothetical protein
MAGFHGFPRRDSHRHRLIGVLGGTFGLSGQDLAALFCASRADEPQL